MKRRIIKFFLWTHNQHGLGEHQKAFKISFVSKSFQHLLAFETGVGVNCINQWYPPLGSDFGNHTGQLVCGEGAADPQEAVGNFLARVSVDIGVSNMISTTTAGRFSAMRRR